MDSPTLATLRCPSSTATRQTATQLASAAVVGIGVALVCCTQAQAQSTGSPGLFGNRSVGGGISAGNRTFGGSGQGLSGATTQAQSNVGQVTGSERFVRQNRQPGQFVGSDSGDTSNFIGSLTQGLQSGNFQGLRSGLQRQGGSRRRRSPAGFTSRSDRVYKVELNVAFDYPQPTNEELGQRVARHVKSASAIRKLGEIEIRVEERTAILEGTVASAEDRALAEQLVALEAGISRVENRLQVVPADDASSP